MENPVAEGPQQTATSRLLRVMRRASTSSRVAPISLTQRSLGTTAEIDRYRLAAMRPLRDDRFLPQAHLIPCVAGPASPTADPA